MEIANVIERITIMEKTHDKAAFREQAADLAVALETAVRDAKLQFRMNVAGHDNFIAKRLYKKLYEDMEMEGMPLEVPVAPSGHRNETPHKQLLPPKEFDGAIQRKGEARDAALRQLFALITDYQSRHGFLHNFVSLAYAITKFWELSRMNGFGKFELPKTREGTPENLLKYLARAAKAVARTIFRAGQAGFVEVPKRGPAPALLSYSVAKSCIGTIKYWTGEKELQAFALNALQAVAMKASFNRALVRSTFVAVEFARMNEFEGSGMAAWEKVANRYRLSCHKNRSYWNGVQNEARRLFDIRQRNLGNRPAANSHGQPKANSANVRILAGKVPSY